jgi:hypothetical protein
MGKTNNHFFSSDKPGSIENQIAVAYRKEMNKNNIATINSKYLNRTCECLARGIEQFTSFMVSPVEYLSYCAYESYVPDRPFREKIVPLIEELINERQMLWHKDEKAMMNTKETFVLLKEKAKKETVDYQPTMNIKGMDDGLFENMVKHICNQKEWYRQTIKRYRELESLPSNAFEMLKESKKVECLEVLLKLEYSERIKKQDTPLFPIYPADITVEKIKDNFLLVMKYPQYNQYPLQAFKMLNRKVLSHNEEAVDSFLKKERCLNDTDTLKLLKSWLKGEKTQKHKKERNEPSIGMAS